MKSLVYIGALMAMLCTTLTAQVTYVQQGKNGNGTSWKDAAGNLQTVLQQSKAGDQIWVAAGTYFPTTGTDRNATFDIKNGVIVLGGFNGTEKNIHERNAAKNTTTLSGAIGSPAIEDNSYNVVTMKNVSSSTQLDGFTITAGNANANTLQGENNRSGGGLYVDGSQGQMASPMVANCVFTQNQARDGGAVYNNGNNGFCSPTFRNCIFKGNEVALDGGAVFNDGRKKGISSPVFMSCQLENNIANYGGAVINYGALGESSPVFTNCHFAGNVAFIKGSGLYNVDVEGLCEPTIQHCQFAANQSKVGGAVYTHGLGYTAPAPERTYFNN